MGLDLLSIIPQAAARTLAQEADYSRKVGDGVGRGRGGRQVDRIACGDGGALDGAGGEELVLNAVEVLLRELELLLDAAVKVSGAGGLDPDLLHGGETEVCGGEVVEFVAEGLEFAVGENGGALVVCAQGLEEEVFQGEEPVVGVVVGVGGGVGGVCGLLGGGGCAGGWGSMRTARGGAGGRGRKGRGARDEGGAAEGGWVGEVGDEGGAEGG